MIQDRLWQIILQDAIATETIMIYNNGKLYQGYDIVEKTRQHKVVNFNGIKSITQK